MPYVVAVDGIGFARIPFANCRWVHLISLSYIRQTLTVKRRAGGHQRLAASMRYKLGRGVDEEAPHTQVCAAGHCDDSRLVSASTAGKTSLHTRGGEEIHKRFMTYIEQVLTEGRRSRSGKDRPPRQAVPRTQRADGSAQGMLLIARTRRIDLQDG